MNHLVSMSDEDFAELKVKPFTPGSCVPRPPSSVNHDRCARGWDAAYCVKCGSQLEFPLPEEASNGLAYFRSDSLAHLRSLLSHGVYVRCVQVPGILDWRSAVWRHM